MSTVVGKWPLCASCMDFATWGARGWSRVLLQALRGGGVSAVVGLFTPGSHEVCVCILFSRPMSMFLLVVVAMGPVKLRELTYSTWSE
jgi:hypothetical protein